MSGGHTALYACETPLRYRLVGQTRDDAAGEAFDKVAKLLGLGYPGGPVVERTARAGDPKAIAFPLAQFQDGAPDFSFSGLKTAVSLYVRQHAPLGSGRRRGRVRLLPGDGREDARPEDDPRRAAARDPARPGHGRGGGQRGPSRRARGRMRRARLRLDGAAARLCTDNAAMIAAAGTARLAAGERADLTLNAHATLPLA